MDIKILSDFSVSGDLYNLIRLIANRVGSHIDYQKMGGILGISRNKIKEYIELLEKTYFLINIAPFTNNIDAELKRRQKMYLADTGLLQVLGKVNSGQAFENAIAIQLSRIGKVQYYQRARGFEIDFILDETMGIEVKETPTRQDLTTLYNRTASAGLGQYLVAGKNPPQSDFRDFVWGGNLIKR